MPNQTIPITLVAGTPPADQQWTTLAQLLVLVQNYMAASIRADVTFVPQVVNDPGSFDGQLIFNIPQRIFKGWDAGTGRYLAVTENSIGQLRNTFVGVDDIARGWVTLNGRVIAAVPGISGAQQAALESIFGVGGTLPTVTPANVNGLPAGNAFGSIPWPQILPAAGVIGGLTFTNPVVDTEADALADDTEILRDTSENLFTLIKSIQAVSQELLTALNVNTTPPIYAQVFAGYA